MSREDMEGLIKRDLANKIANHIIEEYGDLITYNNVISQDYPPQSTAELSLDINPYPGYNTGGLVGGGYNLEINADGRVIDFQEDEVEFIVL